MSPLKKSGANVSHYVEILPMGKFAWCLSFFSSRKDVSRRGAKDAKKCLINIFGVSETLLQFEVVRQFREMASPVQIAILEKCEFGQNNTSKCFGVYFLQGLVDSG